MNKQFLEIAIGDVIATPIRDSVELDAVGELHVAASSGRLKCGPILCAVAVLPELRSAARQQETGTLNKFVG